MKALNSTIATVALASVLAVPFAAHAYRISPAAERKIAYCESFDNHQLTRYNMKYWNCVDSLTSPHLTQRSLGK